jgi:hypothetical protein
MLAKEWPKLETVCPENCGLILRVIDSHVLSLSLLFCHNSYSVLCASADRDSLSASQRGS